MDTSTSTVERVIERGRASGPLWIGTAVSLALFLFAVQLLGTATETAAVPLERLFDQYVVGDGPALGVSWLATYALTNGSVVAALSVSLFRTGILTAAQLFLMVAGSRLGGAAIVVLVGALDYVQKRRYSLGKATGLGTLTFLLTHSIYLPATAVGYLSLPWLRVLLAGVGQRLHVTYHPLAALEPVTTALVDAIGVGPGLAVAVIVLFGSLHLFDRVLRRVDTDWLRERVFRRFRRKWASFVVGVLVTGATTSVAFSLGVVVPLYNRGYLARREVVPYVLGANVGTLADTVVVAVLLRSPAGVTIVVALLALGVLVTLGALLWFEPYLRAVETVHVRLVEDRRYFLGFVVSLVVVPLALAVVPG